MNFEVTFGQLGRKLDNLVLKVHMQAPSILEHARERLAVTLDVLAMKVRPK